ncbi:MAG: S46 family peptidase [Bacteroidales bacterium]|jgi:V8-like Glu-specific endopeptidase|nr:S46 family peptidase [Bacteroidales bacterium]MDX9926906.1 S46 family peptidase [Bacteroidales bacterium]NLD63584.1 S46 family peptidase [Bacteroidales bacterium]HNX83574.1 S46 family peptidase [Bacteroidales bacterium]HPS97057.1 S46 family peptidase [Bacteroidales bacterium]
MRKLLAIIVILVTFSASQARADEGMWLLPLIEKLNIGTMTEMGLKLTAEDLYSINQASVKDAIVIFGGGCTAEIVSPHGLLLTNHHCGYGQIQNHSTVEHDYLNNGFWAMSKEEELPNPGLSVTFLVRIEDVTSRVLGKVNPDMTEAARREAIQAESAAITSEATKGTHYNARVSSFYSGNQYFLLIYEVFSDVRLVGTPPNSIGKYGHDSDNWMWPRHTCDFSVFRVYMGPDGKPAQYSKDNVPLKPKHYLPVSIKNLQKNDFAMVMGYPGTTTRYMTSYEVDEAMKITNANRVKIRGARQEIWMKDMMADPKVNIQYASKYAGSSNYWKFSIGQNAGLTRLRTAEKKAAFEAEYMKWVNADPARKAKYGNALSLIENAVKGRAEKYNVSQYMREALSTELLGFAGQMTMLEEALVKKDAERINGMTGRLKRSVENFYGDYNYPTDQKTTKAMLKLYRTDIDPKYWPSFYKLIDTKFKGNIDAFVDNIFAKSIFVSQEKLAAFLEAPSLKVLQKDPAFIVAKSINEMNSTLMKDLQGFSADLSKGQRLYMAGVMEYQPDKTQYPDANSTMRLTYGKVLDYYPYDAVHYNWYTTLDGVVQKYKKGDYEFDLPQRLIDLNNKREYGRYGSPDGYMPVCFITNNDITGGNSGSPVINGNGELIGLAFDGNWEAMTGNIAFEPDLQRCINVDIRYVLWVIDIYSGAGYLLNEMDIRQ